MSTVNWDGYIFAVYEPTDVNPDGSGVYIFAADRLHKLEGLLCGPVRRLAFPSWWT